MPSCLHPTKDGRSCRNAVHRQGQRCWRHTRQLRPSQRGGDLGQWRNIGELSESYRLINPLGEGTFGQTFKAVKLNTPERDYVALKQLKIPQAQILQYLPLIETEIEALRQLTSGGAGMLCHPNVMCYNDRFIARNGGREYLYIDTEFIDGVSFEKLKNTQWNDKELPPMPALVTTLLTDVLKGLNHLHSHGLVHRDLKPENIMVRYPRCRPQAVLIDFGLACMSDQQCSASVGSGTLSYMSPERILAEISEGRYLGFAALAAADIFAAGICFYEFLTGQVFVPREISSIEEMVKLFRSYPRNFHSWTYAGDPNIKYLIDAMMAADYTKRPTAPQALEFLATRGTPTTGIIKAPLAGNARPLVAPQGQVRFLAPTGQIVSQRAPTAMEIIPPS